VSIRQDVINWDYLREVVIYGYLLLVRAIFLAYK